MQPGETITPNSSPNDSVQPEGQANANGSQEYTAPEPVLSVPPEQVQQPQVPEAIPPNEASSAEPDIPTPAEESKYHSVLEKPPSTDMTPPDSLSWTASEFVEHQKPSGWYLTVIFVTALLSGAVYLMTKDVIAVTVVALASIMFAIVGARKPKSLNYGISHTGLQVGDKVFSYEDFKSFSVIEEGAIDSIHLLPLKRFMPPINLYFPPEQEEQIVDTLAAYLPYEERNHDPIDRLMKRVRF